LGVENSNIRGGGKSKVPLPGREKNPALPKGQGKMPSLSKKKHKDGERVEAAKGKGEILLRPEKNPSGQGNRRKGKKNHLRTAGGGVPGCGH